MRLRPVTPDRLVTELADAIVERPEPRPRIGFDGFAETGTSALVDGVAERIRAAGRPAIRASTRWWWRAASLRLELGRTDIDMLLYGWVDTAALRRELLDPVAAGSAVGYLPRLRDPESDRAVRDARRPIDPRVVVLVDGPFLLADPAGLDTAVHLQVSAGALTRALPADLQWWIGAYRRYVVNEQPAQRAEAIIAYDHPRVPAIGWRSD